MTTPFFSGHKFKRLVPSESMIQPRLLAKGTGAFRPSDQPAVTPARAILLDISVGGLGFRTGAALAVGARITMELQPVNGAAIVREAVVKWFVEDPRTGQTRAGCEWSEPLTEAELQLFSA